MERTILFILPIIGAFVGWVVMRLAIYFGIKKLQANQKKLALQAGQYVAAGVSLDELTAKLTNTEAIDKILPVADEHIEQFLRVKLPAAMPMLAMFISDKLVAEMKAIFMAELKTLFPTIIGQYLSNAKSTIAIDKMVSARIELLNWSGLQAQMQPLLNKIALIGAAVGFIIGIIQISLTLIA